MKAHLTSVRIAPKKANLIAAMIRGKTLHEAQELLRCTNKRAARILEKLLRSAQANAEHNEKQSSSMLVVRTVIVNQGSAYVRSVPRARGRARPIRKFLSHISVMLGVREDDTTFPS
ncbi:50S ribosomal protein L22 [Candidatus Peribacteria bacterium RIFCSPHIGHO2_02_FULL_49_16]|nr:MAG: 50S ribosomal protein L22 [Candidatus Peribacteria bacterium RIFCSPHIGHO2_01_FULL_49_38]OGJ59696.1 MAG: 50S ribosomal protein L22 [Candidatus Peribacteria bacterium RIFCSPHIGHO2_02_FULL_49_16]